MQVADSPGYPGRTLLVMSFEALDDGPAQLEPNRALVVGSWSFLAAVALAGSVALATMPVVVRDTEFNVVRAVRQSVDGSPGLHAAINERAAAAVVLLIGSAVCALVAATGGRSRGRVLIRPVQLAAIAVILVLDGAFLLAPTSVVIPLAPPPKLETPTVRPANPRPPGPVPTTLPLRRTL